MIGVDIIEITRVKEDDEFLKKIACDAEIERIKKASCQSLRLQRIGSIFCVKEATIKALDLGGSEVSLKDIELSHYDSGKPFVILHGVAKEKFDKCFVGKRIEVSLSHTPSTAIAVAIII